LHTFQTVETFELWVSILILRANFGPAAAGSAGPVPTPLHRHQKRGKPGCHRWELMEENVLVKHMKRGKPICSRHQMTGGTRGRLNLSIKYLIKTLEVEDVTVKVPCRFGIY